MEAFLRRGIRWHLSQVLLVSMVPIGLLAGALLYLHWRAQEHERERSQIESVRLLAVAADNALDSSVERLSIFARLWSSSSLTEKAIYEQAREALMANADWSDILAFSADGRGVFQAEGRFGGQMPSGPQFDVWLPVFAERRPVISDIFVGPDGITHIVAVGVPVIRNGKVTHVLIADLELNWYDRLMNQQGLPAGAVLVNAATYTTASGRIRVRIAREGAEALLEVSDDGQGIAPENLPRVFELFFQAESTTDRSAGGLGIGLTLVQRLVKLHGGEVAAHSNGRGMGATFTVRFPALEPPARGDQQLEVAS